MRSIGIALAIVFLISAGQAQEFWQKKEPQQWSENECKKLLEDSPWAKKYDLAATSFTPLGTPQEDYRRDAVQSAGYTVQIRSAEPVRQALIQRAKIRSKYGQMRSEQKQAVDKSAAEFLAQTFPDTIVIGVVYYANSEAYDRTMANYWQRQTLDTLKNSTALIVGRQRIQPIEFSAAPGKLREFEITFPRQVDGKAVISASDKSFGVEFQFPAVGPLTEQPPAGPNPLSSSAPPAHNDKLAEGRAFVEFSVKKLTSAAGELVF